MPKPNLNLDLISNPDIFIEIHDTKKQFVNLFTDLANELENEYLTSIYKDSKGAKVSTGNELEKCPYQVLDIFRNFDKDYGHNIRILNWWGHGLFVFVYFGKELALENITQGFPQFIHEGYLLAKGKSPWDYQGVIKEDFSQRLTNETDLALHLEKFRYLQFFKSIPLEDDMVKLRMNTLFHVRQIFDFHRI